ncbi:MAG: phosphatidate cytidylyltransferase [Micavibrio sp.]
MIDTPTAGRFSGLGVRVLSALVLAPLMLWIVMTGGYLFLALMLVSALVSFYEWYGFAKNRNHAYLVLGVGAFYLSLCFASYVWLRFGYEEGAWLAITIVLAVWASDIGAYFAGKFIGGPKLCPKLSPKKTWAGFFGAIFSSAVVMEALYRLSPFFSKWLATEVPLEGVAAAVGVFVAGAILGMVGQAGDLFISFFKRRADLKDTGHIIPGHGGLLDRIDALLLAAPVFLALCMVFL